MNNVSKLSANIVEITSKWNLPHSSRLSISGLAKEFSVSRTPIVAALNLLKQEGFLERKPNRGFFLTMEGREVERIFRSRFHHDTLYLALAKDALALGDGNKISVTSIMSTHRVTRNKAESILAIAEKEGWLVKSAGHNWIIQLGISTNEDYERFYRFRVTIEPAAILEPGYCVDEAELDRLVNIQQELVNGLFETIDAVTLFETNRELHETMIRWSGNRFYLDAIKKSNDIRRIIEYSKVLQTDNIDKFSIEHIEILETLRTGNNRKTADMLIKHLGGASKIKSK